MKAKSLNLLNPLETPKNFWDFVYYWVLTAGRYVILATTIIVMAVFFARFGLNTILANEQSSISYKRDQVKANYGFVVKVTKVQTNLNDLNIVENRKLTESPNIPTVFNLIPATIFITTIDFNQSGISVSGIADNYSELQDLNTSFLGSSAYSNVSLVELTKDASKYGIQFILTANYSSQSLNTSQ